MRWIGGQRTRTQLGNATQLARTLRNCATRRRARAADASSMMASRRKTLSRETSVTCYVARWTRLPQEGGRNDATTLDSLLAAPFSTRGLVAAGGRKRPDHHADRILQGTPRTLSRHFTHCSTCLVPPAARRASRRAIRVLNFAAAARRQTCTAGASSTLGGDCNAHATPRYATPLNADATGRSLTERNATQRSRKPRNTDATGRNTGTPRNSSAGRGYEMALVNSVTRGTTAMGKRETGLRSAPSPLGTVDNSASD